MVLLCSLTICANLVSNVSIHPFLIKCFCPLDDGIARKTTRISKKNEDYAHFFCIVFIIIKFLKTKNYLFFSKSRISVSRVSSALGAGGSGAGASSSFFLFSLFMALIIKKTQNATQMKSTMFWMNWP